MLTNSQELTELIVSTQNWENKKKMAHIQYFVWKLFFSKFLKYLFLNLFLVTAAADFFTDINLDSLDVSLGVHFR